MTEAFAAFALASNVLQFVDFGSKLAARFRRYYRSSRDSNDAVPDAQVLTTDLQRILEDLESESHSQHAGSNPFRDLTRECQTVAEDLLKILKSLTTQHMNLSRIASLKAAFKSLWKEEDIATFQQRLDHFRSQLILQLVAQSREQIRSSEAHQALLLRDMHTKIEQLNGSVRTSQRQSEDLGSRIVDMVVSKLASVDQAKQTLSLKNDLIRSILSGANEGVNEDPVTPVVPDARRKQLSEWMLSQLHYAQMDDREDSIADAHAATFKWIFDDSSQHTNGWSNLPSWLESNDQIYWVTGKAGSGKSTLMKYICQARNSDSGPQRPKPRRAKAHCEGHLAKWAAPPLKLVTASFFFWASGAEIQTSRSGLLRSLIHQILSQVPSLIPNALPLVWDAICLYGVDVVDNVNACVWEEKDLMSMLDAAVMNLSADTHLCLFIDGLDEFDGDHLLLVQLLRNLLKNPRVKMCVSSRPWDVFEQSFEQMPNLRMELLTYDDIKAYTSERLRENADFLHLQMREPEYVGTLVGNIVEKAAGVFLWVKLVVTSLLAGMRDGDRVRDLQQRLDELPPELEMLYDKMLDSVAPRNVEHTAQLLTIVATSLEPLNIILLSFIDDEDHKSALRRSVQSLTPGELQVRFEGIRRRLNSRTMGLLELNKDPASPRADEELTVQYLHKTVYDYLQSPHVKSRLESSFKKPFDVHWQICIGMLAYLKTSTTKTHLWPNITQFMYSASNIKKDFHAQSIRVIDAMNKTAAKRMSSESWVRLHPMCRDWIGCDHFISLAIRYGIGYYVAARAVEPCIVQTLPPKSELGAESETWMYPLLADTFAEPLKKSTKTSWNTWKLAPLDTKMPKLLIQLGAQVQVSQGWNACIHDPAIKLASKLSSHFDHKIDRKDLSVCQKIVKIFIDHHDEVWSTEMFRSWTRTPLVEYCSKIQVLSAMFGMVDDPIFELSWTFRLLLNPRSVGKLIHDSRLELLTNIHRWLEDATDKNDGNYIRIRRY